ncbi:MAG TPA: cation-translocating P-type ATPase [Vicinamibacterales bacterium]|nr:cation-translocating P-type ATPase [Vicinamibacterales bacterium]
MPGDRNRPDGAPWHALAVDRVLAALDTSAEGLSNAEASARQARYGPNRLTLQQPASLTEIVAGQLRSVIVFLLLGAVVVSLLFGDRVEAAAIAAVLVINTVLGVVTELRARRAIEGLLALDVPYASAIRDGHLRVINAIDLVPGDVIELSAGRQVPADARLIHSVDLRADEAPLTGESFPVEKTPEPILTDDALLAERVNMIYKGTVVLSGLGRALVTATGAATEVGRIGTLVGSVRIEKTPLERRLDTLGGHLVWIACGVAALVAGLGALQGMPVHVVIETAIALAVAAVPEALPAVATIALAVGVHRMARRQALVRRLPAVESLGSTTVVCTDKTRTLTSGEMTVVRVWTADRDVSLDGSDTNAIRDAAVVHLLEAAALASRPAAEAGSQPRAAGGDPVDIAMLRAADAAGIDLPRLIADRPKVGELPFSSERKLMASFHRQGNETVAYVKGAPRAILAISRRIAGPDIERDLDDAGRAELVDGNNRLAREGLRVLAVASGPVTSTAEASLTDLTFNGLVGLEDPPAANVRQTIARLRGAGLRTVMLTGDQQLTAEAIGRKLGLLDPDQRAIDGRALDRMSPDELSAAVAQVAAFSRITPEHKLRIVQSLQARGEIVAMLGDGVNDAAALKQANVGVAMGVRGTDVAKQAASIVLGDDRFETIAAAVEEGRIIFDNIRKFVFYLFSCNVAEILVLLCAGLAGLPLPLLPLQLLWLNLVTDTFPALALAMEPAESDVMTRPPRQPQEAILSGPFLTSVFAYASLITISTLAAFLWALQTSAAHASTVAFMTLGLAQTAHLGNARSERPVLRPGRAAANRFALGGAAISVALQLTAALVPPLAALLHLTPLGAADWIVIVTLALLPAVIGQSVKLVRSRQNAAAGSFPAARR